MNHPFNNYSESFPPLPFVSVGNLRGRIARELTMVALAQRDLELLHRGLPKHMVTGYSGPAAFTFSNWTERPCPNEMVKYSLLRDVKVLL